MLSARRPTPSAPVKGSSNMHPFGKRSMIAVRGSAHGAFPLRGVRETRKMMIMILLLLLLPRLEEETPT
eukprot:8507808-Prorocentrum_lima.AAC.1